jgi:hypothetical protein
VSIDVTHPLSEQTVPLNKRHHFLVGGDFSPGQSSQIREDVSTTPKLSHADLTNHEWMAKDSAGIEQLENALISRADMIDPHGRVEKDHLRSIHRRFRGAALASGSLPPRRARRRAA